MNNLLSLRSPTEAGFGLVDFLISLFLSSLVLGLLLTQTVAAKKYYQEVRSLIDEFMEVNMVIELLTSASKMSGFTPCHSLDKLVTFPPGLTGYELLDKGTIRISRMDGHFSLIESINDTNKLMVENGENLSESVIISDCHHGEIAKIKTWRKSLRHTYIVLTQPLHFHYKTPMYIGNWIEETIYTHQGRLYYRNKGHAEELSNLIMDFSVKVDKERSNMFNFTLTPKNGTEIQINSRNRQ